MSKHKHIRAIAIDGNPNDGHKRITEGRDFAIAGGSKEVHERMSEKLHKMDEALRKKGKDFSDLTKRDFEKMAMDHGLRPEQCQCGSHRRN